MRVLQRLLTLTAVFGAGAALAEPQGQPKVDPKADDLLHRMSSELAQSQGFSVDTNQVMEVVTKEGEKIQGVASSTVHVQRPNKLRAQRIGDLVDQDFYYDGKSLTLHSPSEKYFATVAAPATLEEMLDFARTKLDIVAPAGDFLYKNAYETVMEGVTDGLVVGKGVVEGVRCDHLAFRAPHIDWQIWIQEGDKPLPRKIVITTKDVAGAPQFVVVMTKWNLAPKFSDSLFAFKQPKDAKKVEFQPLEGGAPKAQ